MMRSLLARTAVAVMRSLLAHGLVDKGPTSPSELFERAHDAGEPDALADLGSIYYQQGQLAKARELYEQARDSGDPAALVGLGHIYDLDNSEFIDFDEFNQPVRLRIQDGRATLPVA